MDEGQKSNGSEKDNEKAIEATSDSPENNPPASAPITQVSPSTPIAPVSHPWRWPVTFMVLGILGLIAYWITINQTTRAIKSGADAVGNIGEKAAEALSEFSTTTISQTFMSQLPVRIEEGGTQLEVASFNSVESFRSESHQFALWDYVDLGTTTSEVRVPVTYRYHIVLDDRWEMSINDDVCFVTAPELRPTQPPAIHTDKMEKHSSRGWLRFDSKESLEELTRSITPTVRIYAGDDKHIALVKDTARKGIANFVRKWLLENGHWGTNQVNRIVVAFPDEVTTEPGILIESAE